MKNITITLFLIIIIGGISYVTKQKNNASISTGTQKKELATENNRTLDLRGQGLRKAPEYIFNKTDIEELNLSNNKIEGSLQAEIRHLQNLKVLDLSTNRFSGVPAEIGQLKSLEILDLSNNLLTGLPNELGNLSKLKLLDLSGNTYSKADLVIIRKNLPVTTIIKTN